LALTMAGTGISIHSRRGRSWLALSRLATPPRRRRGRVILFRFENETPANATHWSARTMAKEIGISHTSVQRIWAEAGLKPHLTRKFKRSNDPKFAEKVTDVVGLYMNPPDKALVLCVDEKRSPRAHGPQRRFAPPAAVAFLRGALRGSGRDGETPSSRTEKLFPAGCAAKGEALGGFRAG